MAHEECMEGGGESFSDRCGEKRSRLFSNHILASFPMRGRLPGGVSSFFGLPGGPLPIAL